MVLHGRALIVKSPLGAHAEQCVPCGPQGDLHGNQYTIHGISPEVGGWGGAEIGGVGILIGFAEKPSIANGKLFLHLTTQKREICNFGANGTVPPLNNSTTLQHQRNCWQPLLPADRRTSISNGGAPFPAACPQLIGAYLRLRHRLIIGDNRRDNQCAKVFEV